MSPSRHASRSLLVLPALLVAAPMRPQSAPRGETESVALHASMSGTSADVIDIALNRRLSASEGELVLVVGGVDVTALSERGDARIRYRSSPAVGETNDDVIVYRSSRGRWSEIARFARKAMQAAAAPPLAVTKSATVGNKGQIAEGRSDGIPAPDRRTFQDFVLNAGLRASRDGSDWSLSTQSNYVGVTRREEALRFGVRGRDAPMLDLSDYVVSLRRANTTASLGHVAFGASRHLVNAFASRGATVGWTRGATSLTLGALGGSAQVGWSDIVGMERASNRVFGAAIGQELVASHPGALKMEVTLLDGSKLPISSFSQGAVVDAERNVGGSLQLSAALPNQRFRVASGYTRSRFENPRHDDQLRGNPSFTQPAPTTRGAFFVESNVAVLQNAAIFGAHAPTGFSVGIRHERLDPLFRSIATSVQADRQESVADANLSIGAVVAQVSQNWNHDNLGGVASVLTTNGRATTATVAIPVGSIGSARSHAAWFPTFTMALNRTRQFANKTPTNGAFRDTDLPNQENLVGDASAQWNAGRIRLTLHANRSAQDNRQALRENADFSAGVNSVSVGTSLGTRGDIGFDFGREFQTAKERDETTRTRRATLNAAFRPWNGTGAIGAFSFLHTRPGAGAATSNGDLRLELSQNLWSGPAGARGQLFVRYAHATSLLPSLAVSSNPFDRVQRQQWSIASGLNLRLF